MARFIFARFLLAGIAASWLLSAKLLAEESHTLPDAGSTPVTRQEVWQAVMAELRKRGVTEQQLPRIEDLDLPVALPALAGRRLRVASACSDEGSRRTQFRLECGELGQCLPFLAYIRDYENAGARTASCRLPTSRPAAETALKSAVRAGERATAVFVADRLRMTASVTCLERGREGEVIRVRALDGHIFRARISGPALLEALPQ
ncbi:MAG: flagella basal body P-ring formation protein FlgA [Terriglobales bacterium]